jgi:hypothetical protein
MIKIFSKEEIKRLTKIYFKVGRIVFCFPVVVLGIVIIYSLIGAI